MTTSVEAKIINGLVGHFDGVTLPAGATVAYPNVDFEPPRDGTTPLPYVKITIAKNGAAFDYIAANREPSRMGLFMATVCWPVGAGIVAASELAGAIFDRYAFNDDKTGRRVIVSDGIRIFMALDNTSGVKGDIQGDVYTEIPVLVSYRVIP